uniref:Cysteine dioxygenase n=1 Tax=Arion vulgaris TaxID=1028688 RepID=A0A0B7BB99_9EUPU
MECVNIHHNHDNANGYSEEPMEISHGVSSGGDICLSGQQPSAKFSDPSTLVPPESLRDLVTKLHEVFENDHISVEYVQALMTSYQSRSKEWKRFAKFDPHRYTRNLVDSGNGKFNLMILCWNEGQGSSIHSHANSHCFLKVIDGGVKEELYEWPSQDPTDENGKDMKKWAENEYSKNECAYINDSIGLHRVENPSHTDKAVTLHLYSPPFDECQCFDERTGRAVISKVTFWSKYGRRTPFGRSQGTSQSSDAKNDSTSTASVKPISQ